MRRSRFDLLLRDFPEPGEHVLYSALHDSYVGLDDAALALVESEERGEPSTVGERTLLDALAERGFLVAGRAQDDAALQAAFAERTRSNGELAIILMPTAACNLACTYCYQHAQPTGAAMPDDVESQSLAWIMDRVERTAARSLELTFFGGEPLLRKDYLLRVGEELSRRCAERGVALQLGLVTNGTLLDEPTLLALKRAGLGWVKVTLDGDRGTHDLVRLKRGGQGTFDACVRAVRLVAAHGVAVMIGGNFNERQLDGFLGLLDYLEREGLKEKLTLLNLKPALDTDGASCGGCATSATDPAVFSKLLLEAEARGFPVPSWTRLGPCELHRDASFSIDEQGYVYKCGGLVGHPEVAVAHVSDLAGERRNPVGAHKPWRLCGDCPWVPSCHGGCMAALYVKHGQPNEVSCERRHFDQTALDLVRRRYLAEFYPERAGQPLAA